jgi:hypothetical protein
VTDVDGEVTLQGESVKNKGKGPHRFTSTLDEYGKALYADYTRARKFASYQKDQGDEDENFFANTIEGLQKSLQQVTRLAGYPLNEFSTHSLRVGHLNDVILKYVLDGQLSINNAILRAALEMGWENIANVRRFYTRDVLNRIAIWQLDGKKHHQLTVLDLHPEFAEQGMLNEHGVLPGPFRPRQQCNNDGESKAFTALVGRMTKVLRIEHVPDEPLRCRLEKITRRLFYGLSDLEQKRIGVNRTRSLQCKEDKAFPVFTLHPSFAETFMSLKATNVQDDSYSISKHAVPIINEMLRSGGMDDINFRTIEVGTQVQELFKRPMVPPIHAYYPAFNLQGGVRKRQLKFPPIGHETRKKRPKLYDVPAVINEALVKRAIESRRIVKTIPRFPSGEVLTFLYPSGSTVEVEGLGIGSVKKVIGTDSYLRYEVLYPDDGQRITYEHDQMPYVLKNHTIRDRLLTATKRWKYHFPFGTKVGRVHCQTGGSITILVGSIVGFELCGSNQTQYVVKYLDGSNQKLTSDDLEEEVAIFRNGSKFLRPDVLM